MFNNLVGGIALMLASLLQTAVPQLNDTVVARLAYQLLEKAGGLDKHEVAAFIVKNNAGALALMHWPDRGFVQANWVGPMPENVVGVIHTHPQRSPRPSNQDRAEAARLRMPFYVVSRGALCVADDLGDVQCAEKVPWHRRGGMAGEIMLGWYTIAMAPF